MPFRRDIAVSPSLKIFAVRFSPLLARRWVLSSVARFRISVQKPSDAVRRERVNYIPPRAGHDHLLVRQQVSSAAQ